MITKVYDKVKQILKENWKFFCLLIITFLLFTYEFPYYIDAPGGLMDVTDKIEIQNSYDSSGSLNLAYVSELKATVPTLFMAWINPNWDIIKEEDILYDNETIKELTLRDQLLLQEALSNATIVGYEKAGKQVEKISEKIYVSYKTTDAITTLKVGDQILKIENEIIQNKEQLYEVLSNFEEGNKITITVRYDGKEEIRTATIQKIEDRMMIGVVLTQISDIKTSPEISFHFKKNESGPSGGLMTSLSIYNMLTEKDLTKGKKIVGTGTIDVDGSVGSIGGVKYKLAGAMKKKAEIFLVPDGENYEEAIQLKEKHHYKITIVPIKTFDDALNYLENLK